MAHHILFHGDLSLYFLQGDVDVVCEVYCAIICMLHIGYLTEDDLHLYNSPDRRTAKGKILHELMEKYDHEGNWFSYHTLSLVIDQICGNDIEVHRYSPLNQYAAVSHIADCIEKDFAPIISIEWEDGAHPLLAIGCEKDDEEVITKILCLDPDVESPKVCAWNCYIDVRGTSGVFPFKYVSNTVIKSEVRLDDYIILQKKSKSQL